MNSSRLYNRGFDRFFVRIEFNFRNLAHKSQNYTIVCEKNSSNGIISPSHRMTPIIAIVSLIFSTSPSLSFTCTACVFLTKPTTFLRNSVYIRDGGIYASCVVLDIRVYIVNTFTSRHSALVVIDHMFFYLRFFDISAAAARLEQWYLLNTTYAFERFERVCISCTRAYIFSKRKYNNNNAVDNYYYHHRRRHHHDRRRQCLATYRVTNKINNE